MGRFSPTIQERPRSTFATALLEGVDAFQNARQQKRAEEERAAERAVRGQAAADTHAVALAKYAGEGGRFGTAPDEAGLDLTFRDNPTFEPPSNEQLAAGLRGEPTEAASESSPFAINPRDFAAQLAGSGPPVAATAPLQPSAPPRPQPVIPGAFVPETGTFGGGPPSPTALAIGRAAARTVHLGPTGRYTQIDPTHYIDETATPGAERAADREAQLKIANEAKLGQIAATGALRGSQSEAHDLRARETALGGIDPVTGAPTTGTIAARGEQVRQTNAEKPPPPTRYSRYMTQDGRLWLGSTTDPNDVHPVIDPRTGKQAVGSLPTLAIEGPEGATIVSRPDAIGQAPAIGSTAASVRGLGPGGVFGAGSGIGSVNEMKAVQPNLNEFENLVAQGTVSLNGWDTFREGLVTNARGHGGFVDQGTAEALVQNLVNTNPALAEYATNVLAWVMSDLNLSRGSTDERGRIAIIVDGLKLPVGTMSQADRTRYISQLQQRRDARLVGLERGANAANVILSGIEGRTGRTGKSGAASTGKTPPPQSQDEYDHLIQAGMTDAQIVQRYGQPAAGIKRKP